MKNIKLTDREIALLYVLVLDKIQTVNSKTPRGYVEDLESLELKLSDKIIKNG